MQSRISRYFPVPSLAIFGVFGCGVEAPTDVAERPVDVQPASQAAAALDTVLNTFITDSIQIDQNGAGPGDANLYTGADPADGSPSFNLPAGGPGSYIDWNDLSGDLANHRLLDTDLASGKDPSAFPQSNECVDQANVLSKMDLRYVASANNSEFAYFAVLRAGNNGDAGYYWLFTQKPPHMDKDTQQCGTKARLTYDITGPTATTVGDVLIKGHFKPSAEALLEVFVATGDFNGVDAVSAIDYTSSKWAKNPAGVAAVAVNTTITSPDSLGHVGVKNMSSGNLGTELFAEAAVPIEIFTGSAPCGATFYGSVITRSSGAGGTSPDLKDLAGPALFNFGSAEIAGHLEPTCGLDVNLVLDSAVGPTGNPMENPNCLWEFDDGTTTSTDCSGSVELPAGTYGAMLTVTDPDSTCGDTIDVGEVTTTTPLEVQATMEATCSQAFTFDADVTGGSGVGVEYAWQFGSELPEIMEPSTQESGSVDVSTAGIEYTGSVTVTDSRTDGLECTATAQDTATPLAPIAVYLSLAAATETCPSMGSDAATYNAFASGGDGAYSYTWYGASCAGNSCTIDPADDDFCDSAAVYVVVDDGSELCSGANSETENYSKVTTVTASDN